MNKSAYWIVKTHILRDDEYYCSACRARADRKYKICPNCGLPMKGKKSDLGWIDEMEMMDIMLEDDF